MTETELIRTIAEAVHRAGGRAYAVGGAVRDSLLGIKSKDIDIEVHGLAADTVREILSTVAVVVEKGKSFGVFGLKGYDIDVALPRTEIKVGERHRDFTVKSDPFLGVKEAARRRDFTVNALYRDILTGDIIDPFDGVKDLKTGRLRHVDDTSFGDDALRVLRAAQFAARFSFTVAPETADICRAVDVSHLSAERVAEEMKKALLKADRPSVFFETLRSFDKLDDWFGEVKALIGVPQPERYHPEGDVWNHTMEVIDRAAMVRQSAKEPLGLMLAALCHDFGKVTATVSDASGIHAYGHENEGLTPVTEFLHRMKCPNAIRRYVLNMTALHMKPNICAADRAKRKTTHRMFDASLCPDDLILLAAADAGHHKNDAFLTDRLRQYRERMAVPQVSGSDLLAAGVPEGKELSELLSHAHRLHLSGVDKDAALGQVLSQYQHIKNGK